MTSDEFDYIIVGGSTAGLVVASRWVYFGLQGLSVFLTNLLRLSEDPEVTVGVLEAGDWHQDIDAINVPGVFSSSLPWLS